MESTKGIVQELHTIRDFLRWAVSAFNRAELFFGHGTDNGWDEALHLINHVLSLPAGGDQRFLDARLTTEEKESVVEIVTRRVRERVPAPYLTGEAWFAGLRFRVDEYVLIPRSPIAELIEQGFEPWLSGEPRDILDLCAGSGCIGIACAYAFPEARVVLSDISAEALNVARDNVRAHKLEARTEVVESDLFEALQGKTFDLIVSNPPYVDAADLAVIPPEYSHEPILALASGADGLDFTRRLLAQAADFLNPEGVLVVEVGNSWPALEEAFPTLPFTWVEFERGGGGVFMLRRDDLAG
ncbi:MAG: 50S ribosomal protein L3 N(5)-glutamine methyltransferase [Porticoccaceae bacterium]